MAQIKLDDSLLKELGLDKFSDADKDAMLGRIYQALELRMGMRMVKEVGPEKLKAFEELVKNGKDQEAAQWLKDNVPNYQQIAVEELDKLKAEAKETSRKILERSI